MPQTYHVKLSDGREFNVTTEGGPPSEQDVLANLGTSSPDTSSQLEKPVAPPSRWADRAGLTTGDASPALGFVKGAASGALDILQGMTRNVAGQARDIGRGLLASDSPISPPAAPNELPESDLPDSTGTAAGVVGEAIPTVAALATGGRGAVNALPNFTRAGKNFETVMAAAHDMPVNVEGAGKAALRIMDIGERGGVMPTPVRKFLLWVTDPKRDELTYKEARDFAQNIGRLSVDEMNRLTPAVKREVAGLARELNRAIAQTAKQAGKLDEYQAAMKEYAQAARMHDMLGLVAQGAKKALPVAGAVGLGSWLGAKAKDLIVGGE